MLRDDRPLQPQNVCCEGDSTEPGVQTPPEGQGTWPFCLCVRVSCTEAGVQPAPSIRITIRPVFYVHRLQMRSSSTKPCHRSMWWNSRITLKTRRTSTYFLSSAVGRWALQKSLGMFTDLFYVGYLHVGSLALCSLAQWGRSNHSCCHWMLTNHYWRRACTWITNYSNV